MNPHQSVEKTTVSIFDIVFTFDFNESNLLSFRTSRARENRKFKNSQGLVARE